MNIEVKVDKNPDCIMVPLDMIDLIWPKAEPFLLRSFINDVSTYGVDDIYKNAKTGHWQLWMLLLNDELVGCFVTIVMQEPKAKVLNVLNLGGEGMKYWSGSIREKMKNFAKEQGCQIGKTIARDGFSRIAPDMIKFGTLYVVDLR